MMRNNQQSFADTASPPLADHHAWQDGPRRPAVDSPGNRRGHRSGARRRTVRAEGPCAQDGVRVRPAGQGAAIAALRPPGPIGRLREHHLYEKSRGETAATCPAGTVDPGDMVADAAWTAARSRLERLPVTDQRGRLVGVVSRIALLLAPVRNDVDLREEIVFQSAPGGDPTGLFTVCRL